MTNLFLKLNKDFFRLELNPTEMIILAQVMEYQTNSKVCYMTNEQFAAMLSVSASTVSRALSRLAAENYITITDPKSKKRTLLFNQAVVEAKLSQIAEVKDAETEKPKQIDEVNLSNLPKKPKQNDSIKDNKKIILKDKSADETICDCLHPYRGDSQVAGGKEASPEEFKF